MSIDYPSLLEKAKLNGWELKDTSIIVKPGLKVKYRVRTIEANKVVHPRIDAIYFKGCKPTNHGIIKKGLTNAVNESTKNYSKFRGLSVDNVKESFPTANDINVYGKHIALKTNTKYKGIK